MRRIGCGIIIIAVLAGCSDDPTAVVDTEPAITAATVTINPNNVIGALVLVRTARAASVSVRFQPVDGSVEEEETPEVPVAGDETMVPVLGLWPERQYVFRAIAHGPGGDTMSPGLDLTTGALPAGIPTYTAGGTNPTPGYVAFNAASYGIVIDNTGRVVWYHRFGAAAFLNFQPQATGLYAAGASSAESGGPFTEIDPLGTVTRRLGCAGGLPARFHELRTEADGSYWLMCDEVRTMDLASSGGQLNARVTGTVVQHVAATGERLFQWSAFDHFAITDVEASARSGPIVNWTHGNAIDFDADGNLLISFRALNELTKIDSRTGAVLWRMGGSRNDFAIYAETSPAFAHQHGLRSAGAGSFVVLDNLGNSKASRAERYEYDAVARTARLAATYAPDAPAVAMAGGTTQQLPDGRLLVSYGSGGRVEEYDAGGRAVWRINGNAGYVFRATRIRSLYAPAPY